MDDELIQDFIEDIKDLLTELVDSLLILEKNRNDKDLISKVFRAMHSMKGASAMFGFNIIGDFTHAIEDIYDLIRNDKIRLCDDLVDLTLQSSDHIKELLSDPQLKSQKNKETHENLKNRMQGFLIDSSESKTQDETIELKKDEESSNNHEKEIKTYYVYFKPYKKLIKKGFNISGLISDMKSLGSCIVIARNGKSTFIDEFENTDKFDFFEFIISTKQDIDSVLEQFFLVEEDSKVEVQAVSNKDLFDYPNFKNLIEINFKEYKKLNIQNLASLLNELENSSTKAEKKNQPEVSKNTPEVKSEKNISKIRVSSEKIDEMMNLVSELVTSQAELGLIANEIGNQKLIELAENVEKLSRRFRDNAFHISLVPLERSLTRFQRLVRDTSSKLGKIVIFETEGTETELDKTIIEHITDPIVHILRNSIDHGLTDSKTRLEQGKPAEGKIMLKAFYSGAHVLIEIQDDGNGINPDLVLQKAIKKGLVDENVNLSKDEILNLLFQPGFSTADDISNVSGRGVGMDVVRRKIAEIKGEVEIESEIDIGTKITLKLPLTLSIIDGLLVKIGNSDYIFPLSSIFKIYEYKHEEISNFTNNTIITEDDSFSFINLRKLLNIKGLSPDLERIVVAEYKDTKVGLVVDEIVGKYQTVLKPMGKIYKDLEIISGASILGNGDLAFVLDTNKIINQTINLEAKLEVI
jgi:two-component system chemotaxis sensor kinase CheA